MQKGEGYNNIRISKERQSLLKKYDIPIEFLSYEHIGKCKKPKELERIVRILRSGEEGVYPHLTSFAEERLTLVKPDSQILRVVKPIVSKSLLDPQERKELETDVDDWMQEMRLRERDLVDERMSVSEQPLPQPSIRTTIQSILNKSTAKMNSKTGKRISACDYIGWSKYDADTELNRMDLIEEQEKIAAKRFQEQQKVNRLKSRKETIIEKSLLTGTELSVMAMQEREKGNEAFRAKDYEEALQLYNTSIAMSCDINVYNNRAMTHIKLKNYEKAIDDCNSVLATDCMNLKALLRRGHAYEHLRKNTKALNDYDTVLRIDPMNQIALSAINKLRASDKLKTTRLIIEEIHEDENQ
ncbi:PREDICTED: sperm-associated antigen 1-like [Ceratosolen solmsi marchali]|uniref:Sperm-associated antigen 1-like n=1 Tax=Ceratosolen solmsi marchali TaxID=326594 RepID=A0AAJ7DZM0_9HYME|nr:PREDICTED: sperm-associated antigen 1-like [Ceratosolen solmsi marchali]